MSNKNHLVNPRPPNYGSISSHGHPQGDILEPHLSLPPAFVNHIQQYPYSSDNHHVQYTSLPGYSDEEEEEQEKDFNTLFNEYLITTPFIIIAIFSFILLLYVWPIKSNDNDDNDGSGNTIIIEHWNIFLLGISGWSLVFLLRRPSFFLLSKLIKVKVSTSGILTLLLVGFTEEIVRLIWLYYAHEDASTGNDIYQDFLIAYWLGLGWATAEAIYFIIQNFIAVRWYKEENGLNGQYLEERLELEEILGRPLTKVSAWWGVMWRVSWIFAHIGFSCWIAFYSVLVYPAAMIHGLLHVIWGYCLPVFGIPTVSYVTLILTFAMFLIGLALFGQIV
ncbi:hypothetical protein C2G38_2110496 [Gigaspora rosea]|uniref:Uncharacterized protein n=1 Tax=Gigaspora rosea TaxID=44941 RepID=A0A397UHJ7_9GLOM|nr:hypothetical protein C2G38_2110496 [Gigaspora rosea]